MLESFFLLLFMIHSSRKESTEHPACLGTIVNVCDGEDVTVFC